MLSVPSIPRRLSGNDDIKNLPAEVYEDLLVILSKRGELEVCAVKKLSMFASISFQSPWL